MTTKKNAPTWTDVKGKLADFDRAGLLGLVQSLYAANKDNQSFLHARLGLGEDPLKPYKAMILRWVRPDVLRNHKVSIATAKKAISDYKKAIGQPGRAGRTRRVLLRGGIQIPGPLWHG